jgi:hypothetical protein
VRNSRRVHSFGFSPAALATRRNARRTLAASSRRARPSRPVPPRTHHRAGLANPPNPPTRPRGRNWKAPTSGPADSRRRTRTGDCDMAAVLDWRLPALAPIDPGPLPWLPGIPPTLYSHPVWGDYLAKRSQLVADLADQGQAQAFQGDAQPVWAPPGSHPSALIGEIAVCRAPTASIPKTHDQPKEPNSKRPGPLDITPRPGHHACHRPASGCKRR